MHGAGVRGLNPFFTLPTSMDRRANGMLSDVP
jgi:hypothetical protein